MCSEMRMVEFVHDTNGFYSLHTYFVLAVTVTAATITAAVAATLLANVLLREPIWISRVPLSLASCVPPRVRKCFVCVCFKRL